MPGLTLECVEPLAAGMRVDELVALVNAAYDAAEASMQLEVLEPDPPQDHQVRLRAWYSAIGYHPTGQLDLADVDPDAVPRARYPTRIIVMRKTLVGTTHARGD